ncbi:MAG: protein kinase domain-containing protein [Planctomycetaceae bacterium]
MEKRWIWPFELEEQIGSGAMGVVYRARFVKNNRRVALKLLPADIAANPVLAARFQREMELLKDLRHPNIVHCFGGTCEGDQWFYAMELVEGGTLGSLVQEQGRLNWRQAVEFALQMCAALGHAHDRGIVHRDVKPGNMLIGKSGKLKLSDFGLAQMQAESKLTAAGKTVGSLHYMAPEQITGKPEMSNRTDLYALGCAIYETLTGRPPFLGGTMAEVLQRHVRESPQPVASIAVDCPPQLEALVAELLAKNPDQRPSDAMTVARRLREIDQSVTIKVPKQDRNRPMEKRQVDTVSAEIPQTLSAAPVNRWLAIGLVAALAVASWALVSWWLQGQAENRSMKALSEALNDTNPVIRVFAAQALGAVGSEAAPAIPALQKALTDKIPTVRSAAVEALGKVGSPDFALQGELRTVQQKDSDPTVRAAAGEAIEQLKRRPEEGSWVPWGVFAVILAGVAGAGMWALKKFS